MKPTPTKRHPGGINEEGRRIDAPWGQRREVPSTTRDDDFAESVHWKIWRSWGRWYCVATVQYRGCFPLEFSLGFGGAGGSLGYTAARFTRRGLERKMSRCEAKELRVGPDTEVTYEIRDRSA